MRLPPAARAPLPCTLARLGEAFSHALTKRTDGTTPLPGSPAHRIFRAAMPDPRCKELETFLIGLAPRDELVQRWALMPVYRVWMRDSQWKQRVGDLLDVLRLDEDGIAQAHREANALAAELAQLASAAPKAAAAG